jgi:hypothetical protein
MLDGCYLILLDGVHFPKTSGFFSNNLAYIIRFSDWTQKHQKLDFAQFHATSCHEKQIFRWSYFKAQVRKLLPISTKHADILSETDTARTGRLATDHCRQLTNNRRIIRTASSHTGLFSISPPPISIDHMALPQVFPWPRRRPLAVTAFLVGIHASFCRVRDMNVSRVPGVQGVRIP